MGYLIVFMLLLGVVLVVTSPLRRPVISDRSAAEQARASRALADETAQRIELEAARDAKFREIRDAELDHQTGKLSETDFEAIDSTLRAEAVELLRRLDALERRETAPEDDETVGDYE